MPEFVIPSYQKPAAPLAPVLVASSDSSITLAWEHPVETGGTPITGYQVGACACHECSGRLPVWCVHRLDPGAHCM
jgi:hypothetical protein